MKNRKRGILLLVVVAAFAAFIFTRATVPKQTPVATAEVTFDEGVPILHIADVGTQEHVGFISLYALAYMGEQSYYTLDVEPSEAYAANCVRWLKEHAESTVGEGKGWKYGFDNTFNDVTIHAPWYSAFGQACGIEALVSWYERTGDAEALALAREAARLLFVPVDEGGVLFTKGDDIWFEEIPRYEEGREWVFFFLDRLPNWLGIKMKKAEPSHILNGHMRALIALQRLYHATREQEFLDWYKRGTASLVHWMPLYDAGYWMRYDLNPQKNGLLFRFNNPYGNQLPELAVDEIRLEDPVSGESTVIDVGAAKDMKEGESAYLAGLDWQAECVVDGRTARRLVASLPAPDINATNTKPNSYFYLSLPTLWENNLRTDWLKLTIRYKDEAPGDVVVEQRSITPDEEFVAMRDGALLLTGSGEWREWSIPVRPQDLGWPVGMLYGEKHAQYLEALAADTPDLAGWAEKARGYWNAAKMRSQPDAILGSVKVDDGKQGTDIPSQFVPYPRRSVDTNKVVMQHDIVKKTPFLAGEGYYSPYLIAAQALGDSEPIYIVYPEDALTDEYDLNRYSWLRDAEAMPYQAPKEAAYHWLRENAVVVDDGVVWHMDKESAYNDLVQKAGWQSAFWQRYVIDAFIADDDAEMVQRAAIAYGVPTEEGGLCSSWGGQCGMWFEEVPNNSHILNAHLASIVALHRVNDIYPDERVEALEKQGLQSLRENLYRYDTGYWTKYDMNPQKNILFAFVWEGDGASPPVDDLYLYNPIENSAVWLDIGAEGDFEGASCLAGNRWQASQTLDGRTVRTMTSHTEIKDWNTAAFLHIALPHSVLRDDFLLPAHYFVIRYKDTAKGTWRLFRQSIAEGNVLVMLPLPEAIIHCVGDGAWKTAILRFEPQQMGWYMGHDYQAYHNEQLGIVAEQTGDWYLSEVHEKWQYYLQSYQAANARR